MLNQLNHIVQRMVSAPGLVNSIAAVAYHFCLALPAAFTQPGDHLLAKPCSPWTPQKLTYTEYSSEKWHKDVCIVGSQGIVDEN